MCEHPSPPLGARTRTRPARFRNVEEMVGYYMDPRPEMPCPLRVLLNSLSPGPQRLAGSNRSMLMQGQMPSPRQQQQQPQMYRPPRDGNGMSEEQVSAPRTRGRIGLVGEYENTGQAPDCETM